MPIILFILAGTVHSNTSWLTGPPLLLQTAALEVFPPGALMMLTLVLFFSVDGCENGYSNLHYPQEMPDIVGDLLTYRYVPSSGKIYLSYYLQVNVISVSLACTLCQVPISKLVSIVIHLILLLPLTLRTKLSSVLSLTLRSLRRLVLATNLFPFFCFSSQAECEKRNMSSLSAVSLQSCQVVFDKVLMLSGVTGGVGTGVILRALTDVQCQLPALGVSSGAAILVCFPFLQGSCTLPPSLIYRHL